MINSGMMIFSFFLKKRHSKGTEKTYELNNGYVSNSNESVMYTDVFDMLTSFCEESFLNLNDEKKMKTFFVEKDSVVKYDNPVYRAMSFTVISGGYGIESDLTDSTTNEIMFHRDTHIADNKKFNVLVFVPRDIGDVIVSKGIMIFQTVATYGVKTITAQRMRSFFTNIGLTFETRSISVRTFVERLIEHGNLYKVTLIKDRLSMNPADSMLISTGREERSFIKPTLQPLWVQKLLSLFDMSDKVGIYEINGEEFGDIKVQFKLGDRIRTASLRNVDKFSVVEDFPETIFNNGKYDNKVLLEYMIETANAYKEKMVFTIE